MSYQGTPQRNVPTDEYLHQRLGKINLDSELQDEMLYGRNESSYSGNEPYDAHLDPSGSSWDYSTPQTRNLDSVVTELTPEEIRWFYKLEGEKRWLEFSGYDSLHIETKFREMFENPMSHSKFSAFSDQSSKTSGSYNFAGSSNYFGVSSIRFPSKQAGSQYSQPSNRYGESQPTSRFGESQHKIVVRGGLYEITFDSWKCSSIYWPGEECQITRGTWFYEGTWQPLDHEHSQVLESKHLSMFQGHKLSEYTDNEAKGTVMHKETFTDFIVEWISPNQIYLYSENTPSKVVRTVSTRLGFRKSSGHRLFRGYKSEASFSDRPDVEITHLVFVIHGIGQKMDTGRIIRNTSSFRDCVSWLKQKYFSNFPNHRAEFFPVEWRSNLQLDGDLVDAITPNTLQSLRQMLNASAMDIMYYTSPLYGGEVQRGLREELNRLYSMFSARNPYFLNKSGKISIIAHSLGCVILYDIIMGLNPGSLVQNNQQGLLFQVQNFFCLGSPLSVFLALRWKDSQIPGKMGVILPRRLCHRLYNVFHPTDPVAYRIEPLLVKGYSRVSPLVVQPYNASCHTPYSEMPVEIIVPEQQTAHDASASSQSNSKDECSPGGTPKDKSWSIWGLRNKGPRKSTDGSLEPLQEGLDYRLDYILRESNLGVSYLSALTSHTAYWTNYDVAYFILTQIFPEFEKNDPSLYPENQYSDKFSSYSQSYPQEPNINYENRSSSQFDNPNYRANYPMQKTDQTVPPLGQGGHTNPLPPRFQPPGYPDRQDFGQPNSSKMPPQNYSQHNPQSFSQNIPPHLPMQQDNYSQPPMGTQQPYPQPGYLPPPGPSQNLGPYPTSQQSQNFPPPNYQQHQPQQKPPTFQHQPQQQQPSNYQHPHHQQPSNYQQQQPPQNYQEPLQQNYPQQQNISQQPNIQDQHQYHQPHNFQQQLPQANQMISGLTKNIQMKTGFFDKITEDKKSQGVASSPTKSTKSFFPTFNLSSLTSPVKNLSNSLSNISNQMTNMASSKENVASNSSNVQVRSPGGNFLGNPAPTKSVSPNINQASRTQSPQVQFNQGQCGPVQYQQVSPNPNQYMNQNLQQNIRSSSPYDVQIAPMGIRSGSPVSLQNRCSPMQYGPIETPVGAIKPKTIRLQPKVPNYESKIQFGTDSANVSNKSRCVSPLGQSRVVCSGNRTSLPTGSYGLPLGGRSLSSGNLRNSTIVSGTYPTNRSNFSFVSQAGYLSGLDRRTMSRPNLSTTGSSYSNSGLGVSSLVYNSPFGGTRSYLNRDYSGPSSRGIRRQPEKQSASNSLLKIL